VQIFRNHPLCINFIYSFDNFNFVTVSNQSYPIKVGEIFFIIKIYLKICYSKYFKNIDQLQQPTFLRVFEVADDFDLIYNNFY